MTQPQASTTDLTVPKPAQNHSLKLPATFIPTRSDWEFMVKWGEDAIKTGMMPSGVKNGAAAGLIILKGRELDIPFMTAIAHLHVINGKISMSAELMQAQARKYGVEISIVESTNEKATVRILRPEKNAQPFVLTFTIEDAKRAQLLSNPTWSKYPRAMLWSRAVSAALRMACPEALMGVSYTPEELGANVDESGNVIETTGTRLPDSKPKQTGGSVGPKPLDSPPQEPQDIPDPTFRISEVQLKGLQDYCEKLKWDGHRFSIEIKQHYNKTWKDLTLDEYIELESSLKKLVTDSTQNTADFDSENFS